MVYMQHLQQEWTLHGGREKKSCVQECVEITKEGNDLNVVCRILSFG